MQKYQVTETLLKKTLEKPNMVVGGYGNRKIYHKKLDGYVLRVITEEEKSIRVVVTVYIARSGRYGI